MDIIYYLLICVTWVANEPESCAVYTLQPQYEMSAEVIAEKIVTICEVSSQAARDNGGTINRCEVFNEFPEGYSLNKPGWSEGNQVET